MTRSFKSKTKQTKTVEVNFNIFYITQYIQNITISTCSQYKILSMKLFTFLKNTE